MKMFIIRCVVMIVALCFIAIAAFGNVPRILTLQGKLTDSLGQPVPDSVQSVTFRLYDVETEGTPLWQEVQNVQVNGGIFNINLGAVTPITLPFDVQYWLGMQPPSSNELSPRTLLTTAPYAVRAEIAESVVDGAITTEKIADGAITSDKLATGILGEIGYAEVINDQGPITTEVDLTGLSVTVTVPEGGRKVKITGKALFYGTNGQPVEFYIKEGSTYLDCGSGTFIINNRSITQYTSAIVTPTAGSHTYKLSAKGFTVPMTMHANPGDAAFLLVEVI